MNALQIIRTVFVQKIFLQNDTNSKSRDCKTTVRKIAEGKTAEYVMCRTVKLRKLSIRKPEVPNVYAQTCTISLMIFLIKFRNKRMKLANEGLILYVYNMQLIINKQHYLLKDAKV